MVQIEEAPATPNKPAMQLPNEISAEEYDRLTDDIVNALKSVYDPEIPADIYGTSATTLQAPTGLTATVVAN